MTKIRIIAKDKKTGEIVDSITTDSRDIEYAFYQDFNMCDITVTVIKV